MERLKCIFNPNQAMKLLDLMNVDDTQDSLDINRLHDLKLLLLDPMKRPKLIKQLSRGWISSRWPFQLKSLVVTHYLLRMTNDERLADELLGVIEGKLSGTISKTAVAMEQTGNTNQTLPTSTGHKSEGLWIKGNIINPYIKYLSKYCTHIQLLKQSRDTLCLSEESILDIGFTVHCFQLLNLLNTILDSRVAMMKVGRYFPKCRVMVDLYACYLADVKIMNDYLRLAIYCILQNHCLLKDDLLRHSHSFVVEAQNSIEKIYDFQKNRYYFSLVDIRFKVVEELDLSKMRKFLRYARKAEPSLASYSDQRTSNMSMVSLANISQKSSKREESYGSRACYSMPKIRGVHESSMASMNFQHDFEETLQSKFPEYRNF